MNELAKMHSHLPKGEWINISPQVSHEAAFRAQTELQKFGKNARLLFALRIKNRVDDIESVAADCLTDGPDDKKCDLIYVNKEEGRAIIAQAYEAEEPGDRQAPANKAADLNVAVSWVISKRDPAELPIHIRSAAIDLRSALQDGLIRSLHLWYVHNLAESKNVGRELSVVSDATKNALATVFPGSRVEVFAVEIGRTTLEDWYRALSTPILVTDKFIIRTPGGYRMQGDVWDAFVTSVEARWLHQVFREHGLKLFSANVRDYLGSRRSDSNINNGIKTTAARHPARFWAYNNGLTCLVNDFRAKHTKRGVRLEIEGLSIVNGAQTTGAVGSLDIAPDARAMVPFRVIKCTDEDAVHDISLYNNSQNKITASDFRSNDSVQRRLREEFGKIPQALYLGGRRGGDQDTIRRASNLLPSDTVAQALAAFHQAPITAYNDKAKIWSSDAVYSEYFNDDTHAEHIVFVYSLLRCIENHKLNLRELQQSMKPLTDAQREQLDFLRNRGATLLLLAAVARCSETYLGHAITSTFQISFGPTVSPKQGVELWQPIVTTAMPFCRTLVDAVQGGFNNITKTTKVIDAFKMMVDATAPVNSQVFETFRAKCMTAQ